MANNGVERSAGASNLPCFYIHKRRDKTYYAPVFFSPICHVRGGGRNRRTRILNASGRPFSRVRPQTRRRGRNKSLVYQLFFFFYPLNGEGGIRKNVEKLPGASRIRVRVRRMSIPRIVLLIRRCPHEAYINTYSRLYIHIIIIIKCLSRGVDCAVCFREQRAVYII